MWLFARRRIAGLSGRHSFRGSAASILPLTENRILKGARSAAACRRQPLEWAAAGQASGRRSKDQVWRMMRKHDYILSADRVGAVSHRSGV